MKIIEAINLSKTYFTKERKGLFKSSKRVVQALRDVSFFVNKGEIFSIIGPNGAGKTTTIKILSTLLLPDSGEAYVNGYNVVKEQAKVRESIGVVLYPDKGFYSRLTGIENLIYYGRLYGLSKNQAKERAMKLAELVNLERDIYRRVEEYSLGMKAKLSIAKALINDAPILFLDEPTVGLDPISARKVRELIKELSLKGKTILLTSHNMWEVENLSNRILVINKGSIVMEGSPREIKEKLRLSYSIEIEVIANNNFNILGLNQAGLSVRGNPMIKIMSENPGEDLIKVLDELRSKGFEIGFVRIQEPSLEEAFIKLVEK